MCLAVPGRVCERHEEAGLRLATVDFGGVRKRVCVETLPDVAVGAWVLVHAGIALQEIDAAAAAESLRALAAGTDGAP
ncbi:MAG: HypC/HybG/HupF family hydrogenase formation chaperone [Proteobacteria bacterium]|nr:MAG: HypC/HybG/HupF family hydrogenase formation chaperone [Pseudomonadota bacterium]